uniref:amino acid transporter AVT1C-like n=1 Tax=Styela clava TaxID=7725 RepID=UPI001939CC3C|nr:amino acid transporter AVT1C-like [Styela clava]
MQEILQQSDIAYESLSPTVLQAQNKGLGIFTAAVFIVGTICGTGVQTIPQAIVYCGYIGPVIVVACGVLSCYTGTLLGRCWTILRTRYPEYESERITDPYPTIAYRAGGKVAEIATRVCIDITLFGSDTVFMLLISENLSNLITNLGHHQFSICYLMLIITAVITPLTWFGTPKDFWQGGIIGAVTSIVASFFILGSLITAIPDNPNPQHADPQWSLFFSALGTILYAYSGASCFPTIQVDMKEPNKFPVSAVLGIITVMLVYLLVGIPGFVILGDDMDANVLNALPAGWILYTVNILITSHLIFAYLINNNPVCQEIEGFLKIPDRFGWKRILVRTLLALAAMFIGLTVPHFDIILSILGGSTIALTNFIFPPLFYLLLSRQRTPSQAYGALPSYIPNPRDYASDSSSIGTHIQSKEEDCQHPRWMQINLELHVKVLLIEIIMIGAFGGASSTYFSFASVFNGQSEFTVPCFVNMSVGI